MTEVFRASITGIDGAGKDTISELTCQKMRDVGVSPIVKLNRPSYRVDNNGQEEIFCRQNHRMDKIHNFADQHHVVPLIVAVNAINVMLQSRTFERQILSDDETKLLISSRDWIIDPVVYAEYYLPRISSKISLEKRLEAMQKLTGIERELIIQLKVDPESAVERIAGRMKAESESSDDIMRAKWQHMHENADDLRSLQAGYEKVFTKHREMNPGLRIVEIGTDDKEVSEVAYLASLAIKSSMDGSIYPGEKVAF